MGSRVMDAITRSWRGERRDAGPGDLQVELHQRLLVDAGACLVDADDLRQRQDTALFQGLGLGGPTLRRSSPAPARSARRQR